MSEDILEANNDPKPTPAPSKSLSPASIIGIGLILAVLAFAGYVASYWIPHNSRIARLKAKNGDFVQLQHRGDGDEFGNGDADNGGGGGGRRRNRGNGGGDDNKEEPKAPVEPPKPSVYDQYMKELFPQPIQVVYWKDVDLKPEDVDLLMEFADVEVLNVSSTEVSAQAIEKLLKLPNLRRLKFQGEIIDTSTIASWVPPKKLVELRLVNGKWKSKDMDQVREAAAANKEIASKLQITSQTGPSFGGM